MAGEKNRCFLPGSQRRSYQWFSTFRRNFRSLHVVPGYRHLDLFLGERAAVDVFPTIIEELERPVRLTGRTKEAPMIFSRRNRWLDSRYANVDGIPFQMGVRSRTSPALFAGFTIDAVATRPSSPVRNCTRAASGGGGSR